jgi:hypothetical protein
MQASTMSTLTMYHEIGEVISLSHTSCLFDGSMLSKRLMLFIFEKYKNTSNTILFLAY